MRIMISQLCRYFAHMIHADILQTLNPKPQQHVVPVLVTDLHQMQQIPNANANARRVWFAFGILTKYGDKKLAAHYWTHYVDIRFYQQTGKICFVKTA